MANILIVEDEAKIARFVELELTHEGYGVEKTDNGRAGVELALSGRFDLVLLDILLPELSGMEVLRRVRRESDVPVIMLTARDAVMDKVAGLDAGANDYITKPFAIEELLARIRVVLKQREMMHAPAPDASAGSSATAPASNTAPAPSASLRTSTPTAAEAAPAVPGFQTRVLRIGRVALDVDRHEVRVDDDPVQLTNREFEVLKTLMEHRNIVLLRDTLAREALDYDYVGETNAVDVHIRHLRAKIDERYGIKLISTVRGVGYVIREA
ncbi:MAG: response regulator transcription factor [Atopobiaceae bacterium]|nr:response regulator transcription factor [Atopobiaceae bacterium]